MVFLLTWQFIVIKETEIRNISGPLDLTMLALPGDSITATICVGYHEASFHPRHDHFPKFKKVIFDF